MAETNVHVRAAEHDDYDDVAAFTQNTWPDRDSGDYIPRIYHDWIEGEDQRTAVAEVDGDVVAIAQSVLLSDWEAWNQGLRVHPDYRGRGISVPVTEDLFDWARERGATTARVMVFSWNVAGLGQARATGYEPITEFRFAHPEPDADARPALDVTADPDAAWRFWTESDARADLRGLALDPGESWATSQLTRDHLRDAAADDGLFVVQDDGTKGFAHRVRQYDVPIENDDDEEWAEYGVGAWSDVESARALFAAVARDAGERGADRTRVVIPETARAISDAAACRAEPGHEPHFVMGVDLTAEN